MITRASSGQPPRSNRMPGSFLRIDFNWVRVTTPDAEKNSDLFPNDHRRADRSGVVKRLSHSFRQTNATMRRRVWRHIALMHGVSAAEKHRVGHPRTVETCAGRTPVFATVDVKFYDVAGVIDIIAKN